MYAQIHHDATTEAISNEKMFMFEGSAKGQVHPLSEITTVRKVTATSLINKPLGNKDGRYWSDVNRQEMAKQDGYNKSQTIAKEKKSKSPKSGEEISEKVKVSKDTSVQEEVILKESGRLSFN